MHHQIHCLHLFSLVLLQIPPLNYGYDARTIEHFHDVPTERAKSFHTRLSVVNQPSKYGAALPPVR